MERVQYSLERSLPQLRLLDEQKLLSKDELRSITSQRQAFEARLIRRKADKADFEQYLALEHDLNSLVQLRARERVREASKSARKDDPEYKKQLLPRNFFAKQAASYSAVCIGIFERMVRKFRYDVDAWEQYIAWARSRKMRVVAGRVYARALSLHPSHVPLWISAADHELNGNADTTAARALLQRGLRMNQLVDEDAQLARDAQEYPPAKLHKARHGTAHAARDAGALRWVLTDYEKDVLRLWVEYFRMELVFIERLRRRWRVLGLDSGAEAAASLPGDDAFASARATAHTVAPEARDADASDDDEDEAVAAAEAEVDDQVPHATLDEEDAAPAGARTTPRAGIAIPPGHAQIMGGAIPLVLLTNAQKSLPASVQLYLFTALLQLLAAFPFFDSVVVREYGEVLSLRTSDAPLGSGDQLRRRLVEGVLRSVHTLGETMWSEAGQLADAVLHAVHPLLHPWSHSVHPDMECSAMPASGASEELEQNGLLHGASRLHPTFVAALDTLYALAEIPASLRVADAGAGVHDPWSICRPVLFVLQVVSLRLVERTAETDGAASPSASSDDDGRIAWQPTPYLAMLAQSGDLPVAIRTLTTAFRKRLTASDAHIALAFLATLRFLANPTRAGIEESHLCKYLARAEEKLLATLLRDGPHLDLAWLAIEQLVRRFAALRADDADSVDDTALSALFADAHRLVETDALHPGAWAMYERIGTCVAERRLPDQDAAAPFAFPSATDASDAGAARAAWLSMLQACTTPENVAQDTSAPVWGSLVLYLGCTRTELPDDAAMLAPHPARVALWRDFVAWAQHAMQPAPDAPPKQARKAARWAWATMERAVSRSGALLASSQLVGTARAHAQALHDAVVEDVYAAASAPALGVADDAEAERRRTPQPDDALAWLLQHSSASVDCWLALAHREAAWSEAASDAARAASAARAVRLYERAVAQAERTDAARAVDVWTAYLTYLVHTQRDMRTALATLQRALPRLQAADVARAHALQHAWHALVDSA